MAKKRSYKELYEFCEKLIGVYLYWANAEGLCPDDDYAEIRDEFDGFAIPAGLKLERTAVSR